eukprot:scaffold47207_cov49-Phaeocystis_antarctica.AAC.1
MSTLPREERDGGGRADAALLRLPASIPAPALALPVVLPCQWPRLPAARQPALTPRGRPDWPRCCVYRTRCSSEGAVGEGEAAAPSSLDSRQSIHACGVTAVAPAVTLAGQY